MTIFPSVVVVSGTALLGLALAVPYARGRTRAVRIAGPLHGLLGASGLGLLLLALRGPPRGVVYGAGSFGKMAVALLVCAILAGLLVLRTRLKGRDPMLAIGLHASLAIFGLVMLAAYASVPQ